MAVKTTNFIREGTPFDLFQIGKNYTEVRQQIMLTLEYMYNDYKKEDVYFTFSKYESLLMSETFLHKLVELGIIIKLTDTKGNNQYKWNIGEDPDFIELTNRVLTS